MKTLIAILLTAMPLASSFGQQSSSASSHHYHTGDETSLLRIVDFRPGEAGDGVVWDCSGMEMEDKGDRIAYATDTESDSVVVAIAGDARFRYRQDKSSIRLVGYETNQRKVEYDIPQIVVPLPLRYGKAATGTFHGSAMYCESLMMRQFGTYSAGVDAVGELMLPDWTTLGEVYRVHGKYDICDIVYDNIHTKAGLTAYILKTEPLSERAIRDYVLAHGDEAHHVETYIWYAEGYRYPIIQAVACRNGNAEGKITALYFPPKEQEKIYDAENEKIRSRMESEGRVCRQACEDTVPSKGGNTLPPYYVKMNGDVIAILIDGNAGSVATSAVLSDSSGIVYRSVSGKSDSPLYIDCRDLRYGDYALRLSYDGINFESKVHYASQ